MHKPLRVGTLAGGIDIIDTIQLMEVVQGLLARQYSTAMNPQVLYKIKNWFAQYILRLTTCRYGKDEMNAENNHGTCWVMQVAYFARFTGNQQMVDFCSNRYKQVLLPTQMEADGSFPANYAAPGPMVIRCLIWMLWPPPARFYLPPKSTYGTIPPLTAVQ